MTEPTVSPAYRRLARFAVAWTLVVFFLGANVTSTKSGDAIPTWPWGFVGTNTAEWIELWHRFVAGFKVVVSVALVVTAPSPRIAPGVRKLAWAAFGVVVVQAALGGVRVLLGAADETSAGVTAFKVVHASVAQVYFLLAVALAARTSAWWHDRPQRPVDDTGLSLLRGGTIAIALLFVQSVLGAIGRHDVLPREVHAVFALPVLVMTARFILVASADTPKDLDLLRTPAGGLGFLAALQLVLGIASYIVAMEVPDPLLRDVSQAVTLNLHLVVASVMTGLALTMVLRTVRVWGLPTDERMAEARRAAGGDA